MYLTGRAKPVYNTKARMIRAAGTRASESDRESEASDLKNIPDRKGTLVSPELQEKEARRDELMVMVRVKVTSMKKKNGPGSRRRLVMK